MATETKVDKPRAGDIGLIRRFTIGGDIRWEPARIVNEYEVGKFHVRFDRYPSQLYSWAWTPDGWMDEGEKK